MRTLSPILRNGINGETVATSLSAGIQNSSQPQLRMPSNPHAASRMPISELQLESQFSASAPLGSMNSHLQLDHQDLSMLSTSHGASADAAAAQHQSRAGSERPTPVSSSTRLNDPRGIHMSPASTSDTNHSLLTLSNSSHALSSAADMNSDMQLHSQSTSSLPDALVASQTVAQLSPVLSLSDPLSHNPVATSSPTTLQHLNLSNESISSQLALTLPQSSSSLRSQRPAAATNQSVPIVRRASHSIGAPAPSSDSFMSKLYELVRSAPRAAEKLKIFDILPEWKPTAFTKAGKSHTPVRSTKSVPSTQHAQQAHRQAAPSPAVATEQNTAGATDISSSSSPVAVVSTGDMSCVSSPTSMVHSPHQVSSRNPVATLGNNSVGAAPSIDFEQQMLAQSPVSHVISNSALTSTVDATQLPVSSPSLMDTTASMSTQNVQFGQPQDSTFASQGLTSVGTTTPASALFPMPSQNAAPASPFTHPQMYQSQHNVSLDYSPTDTQPFKVPHVRASSFTSPNPSSVISHNTTSTHDPSLSFLAQTSSQADPFTSIGMSAHASTNGGSSSAGMHLPFSRTTDNANVHGSAAVQQQRASGPRSSRSPSISFSRKTAEVRPYSL